MLGGVDERESEHLTELNALRSLVVALTAELTGAKGKNRSTMLLHTTRRALAAWVGGVIALTICGSISI